MTPLNNNDEVENFNFDIDVKSANTLTEYNLMHRYANHLIDIIAPYIIVIIFKEVSLCT